MKSRLCKCQSVRKSKAITIIIIIVLFHDSDYRVYFVQHTNSALTISIFMMNNNTVIIPELDFDYNISCRVNYISCRVKVSLKFIWEIMNI